MPNSAPTLDSTFRAVLTPTFENAADPPWTSVASLLSGGADSNADELGIAITSLDTSIGTWQYSTDTGVNWLTIHASLMNSQANELGLLLGPTAVIRMLPFGELNGTLADAITFRAWDQTSGNQGNYVVIAGAGLDTAFSSDSDTASLTVSAVNDAPTFAPVAGTGKVMVPVGSGTDAGQSVTVQPDGKIVVAGYSFGSTNNDFSVIRLNSDGTLDTNFNGTGKVLVPVGPSHDIARSVTLQADGKIVIAGYSSNVPSGIGVSDDFSIVRLNADGTLDTSFNGSGKALIPVGSTRDNGHSVTMQPDGKIVVAGFSSTGFDDDFSLIRLNADGTLDTSFNSTGVALVRLGALSSRYHQANSVTVQPDGKIVLAGVDGSYNFAVIRLNADGTFDNSFNGTGKVQLDVGGSTDNGQSVIVQPDGKILVAGFSFGYVSGSFDFSLVRLNADGTLDTTFNGTGQALVPVGGAYDRGFSVCLQPDGKIVVAGQSDADFSVIRLNANGTLDTTFNGTGKASVPVGIGYDLGLSVTVQSDGKIVVAGYSQITGLNYDFSLIRLNADGTLDTTFNGTAANTLDGTVAYIENAAAIALDGSVSIYDADLAASGSYDGAIITLTRNGGASPDDIFSGRGNLSFSAGNAVLSGVTIGTVTNSGGTLAITFNSNATQARVNETLSSVGYANASDNPSASVQIDWTFSDGNTSAQGTGGALTASGSTTVSMTPVNDLPTGAVTISGTAIVGNMLTASNTLADAEGMATSIAYQWKADGVDIEGADGDTFTITSAEYDKVISVEARYTDGGGTVEAVTETMAETVGAVLTASASDKFLFGSFGNDVLIAGGSTKMIGGDGDDTYLPGGKGQVIEAAGEGTDTVISKVGFTLGPNLENLILEGTGEIKATGNELDNQILGNDADNTLFGLAGADTLTGAAGADRFLYTSVGETSAVRDETITDFNAAEGDSIHLTRVDAQEGRNGNQKFAFIGSQPFSAFPDAAGLLRFDPATHRLEGSVNADSAAEFVIVLTGVTSLAEADIYL